MYKYFTLGLLAACLLIVNAQTKPSQKPKAKTSASSAKSSAAKPKTAGKSVSTPAKISFTINGVLENYPNYHIRLNLYHYNKIDILDSLKTDDSGRFVFKKTLPENSVVYVQYSPYNAVPLIAENGSVFNLVIHTNVNGLNYDLTGKNIEKSLSLYNFLQSFSKINGELKNIELQLSKATDATQYYQLQEEGAIKQQELELLMDSAMRFKSPLESYFILFNLMEQQTPAEFKKILDRMKPGMVKSTYYKELNTLYETNKGVEIGDLAPDINLKQPNGTNLKLSSLRGKVVLIDFWASWCGPCRAEFPNVKAVYEKYKSKGFEIYGVSLDKDSSSWTNSIKSLGLNWKHVSDLKYWNCAPAKVYKVSGIPATFLIDKDGRVIAKNLRGPALEAKLKELFP